MKKQNDFIPLERINKKMFGRMYKYSLGFKGWVGLGLVGVGVATLPLPTGSPLLIGLGVMLLTPIKIMDSLRNKKEDVKHIINKRLVMWGLR